MKKKILSALLMYLMVLTNVTMFGALSPPQARAATWNDYQKIVSSGWTSALEDLGLDFLTNPTDPAVIQEDPEHNPEHNPYHSLSLTTDQCAPGTFTLTGDSATDGSDGNIRTFTSSSSVKVKTSAFSRKNSGGTWETAYLGSYSDGLGVTDRGEGNGSNNTHRVDNLGDRNNYVLFEFDRSVVVDKTLLANVGADTDASFWIGTRTDPFNNHLSLLSDSILSGFGQEDNDGGGAQRTADVNASSDVGNVLVVASRPG